MVSVSISKSDRSTAHSKHGLFPLQRVEQRLCSNYALLPQQRDLLWTAADRRQHFVRIVRILPQFRIYPVGLSRCRR